MKIIVTVLQKVSEAQLVRSEGKMTHYSKGSEKPPMKGDVLRLYSMRFCPFAQVGFFIFGNCKRGKHYIELKNERPFDVFRDNFLK